MQAGVLWQGDETECIQGQGVVAHGVVYCILHGATAGLRHGTLVVVQDVVTGFKGVAQGVVGQACR